MPGLPVIFLAFANDKQTAEGFLRNLTLERNAIREALKKASTGENPVCELVIEPDATLSRIFDTFQDTRYRDRIAIFHYGGHARDYRLLLEDASGQKTSANASGLISFLANQRGLQLVFLNGCSTQSQADGMIEAGIPAVIGTTRSVPDEIAQILSQRFYSGLGEGISLDHAWNEAMHFLKSNDDDAVTSILAAHEDEHDSFPWHIRYTGSSRRIREWNLPEAAGDPIFGLPDLDEEYYLKLPISPYPGLHRFRKMDAAIFFGRNKEVRALHDEIAGHHPVILLHGQSGVGKSSLLEAGLIPRLESSYELHIIRRLNEEGLSGTLRYALGKISGNEDPETTVPRLWQLARESLNRPLILILDQAEESFTRSTQSADDEWGEFIEELRSLEKLLLHESAGKILLSFRTEYFAQVQDYLNQAGIAYVDVFLRPLRQPQIIEAITGVTKDSRTQKHYHLSIASEDFALEIANDLHSSLDSPIAPTLQILLEDMWQKDQLSGKHEHVFNLALYRQVRREGFGLKDYLSAEMNVLSELDRDPTSPFYQQEIESSGLVLDLLMHFVRARDTADAFPADVVASWYPHRQAIIPPLIQQLSEARVLNYFVEQDVRMIGLLHDTLGPVVREMFESSWRPGQRARRILEADTHLDDHALAKVEEGQSGMRAWTDEEVKLVESSREERKKRLQQRRLNRALKAGGSVIIVLFGILAFIFALAARKNALISSMHALSARAQLTFNNDHTLALNQALTAFNKVPDKFTGSTLSEITSRAKAFYKFSLQHKGQVNAVAISPDGQFLLTGGEDSTAILWSHSGVVTHIFSGHKGTVTAVAFSPDGKYILSGSKDHSIIRWSIEGAELHTYSGHHEAVSSVAFSPNGQSILSGSEDSTAILWSLRGDKLASFKGHHHAVTDAVFSPSGQFIFTGSEDHTARLWTIDGTLVREFPAHQKAVLAVAFSPDGNHLLTGSEDHTAKLWSVDGTLLQTFTGHTDEVWSLAFSPDGLQVITGSWDNSAKLWNLEGKELQSFSGHQQLVASVTFSPDGNEVLTGSWDHTAKLWTLNGLQRHIYTNTKDVLAIAFSPDGKYILTGTAGDTATLWSLDGTIIQTFNGHAGSQFAVEFAPNGKRVLIGFADGTARLFDLDGTIVQSYAGYDDPILSVAFSPDGKNILTGSWDHTARLWSIDGQELQTFNGHEHIVNGVAFTPDGKHVVTGSWDHTAKLWSLDGKVIHTYEGHTGSIWSVAVSPNGKWIVTGSGDNTARVWSMDGNEKQTLIGHEGAVRSVKFSPDGKYILTGSVDQTSKLWTLNGIEIQTCSGHQAPISSVAFSPDGFSMLTGSLDKTTRLWHRWDYIQKAGILAAVPDWQ